MSTAANTATKIRKFRLHARPSAILRNLKSLMDGAQVTPELEKAIETEALAARARLDSAALFDTLTPAQSCDWMSPLWQPSEGKKSPVALTVFVATIGISFESELADALSRGEVLRSRILTALGEELADQAANFIERLVSEDARQDSCELEDRKTLTSSAEIQSILTLLGADRLAITYDAAGHLTPRFTRAGAIPWGPPAKKKK